MSLTNNDNGFTMPVMPMSMGYGNGGMGGFGSDASAWWLLILLFALGGWGNNGFGGGFGGGNIGGDIYPWMNQANLTSEGFQNQLMNDNITSIRDGIHNLSTQLCNCCSDMAQTVNGGFANAEVANNARQIANMQTAFATQMAMNQGFNQIGSQLADCCCANQLATNDLKYTIATENCADRAAVSDGIRDVITAGTANTQSMLNAIKGLSDQICQDKIDAKNEKIADLERQLTMANLAASQIAQTAQIRAGQVEEVDALYQRLHDCPVPTMPVYGSQPIFTCNGNNGCGCGCNGGF